MKKNKYNIVGETANRQFQVVRFANGRYGVLDTTIEGLQLVASGMTLKDANEEIERRNLRRTSAEPLTAAQHNAFPNGRWS